MKNVLMCLALVSAVAVAAAPGYHEVARIQIGGEGGWDYITVDPDAGRLYVSHATKAVVVDLKDNKVIGDIPDTAGIHGIAIARDLNRGFTSNGRANNVTVFDLTTLKPLTTIATGQNPDAILYEPGSKRVFTFNGRSHDATVIDAPNGRVVKTIPLGGKPEFSASDDHGKVYVNIEDTAEIAVIDVQSLNVAKRYKLTGCEEPSGLALDRAKQRLFSVCGNKVMVISDPEAGKVVSTVPTGAGTDGAAFDPGIGLAFASNGEGTLTVVSEVGGKYQAVENVKTEKGARTITLDPKTHRLYLPGRFGEFGVLVMAPAQP